MIRAVVDTNVLISGLISKHSPPAQIVDRWLLGEFSLITTAYQVNELLYVLDYPHIAKRIKTQENEKQAVLEALKTRAIWTEGVLQLPGVTRDVKDDPLVSCAVEGHANFLVSGDKDILELVDYADVHMITPTEFLKTLGARTAF